MLICAAPEGPEETGRQWERPVRPAAENPLAPAARTSRMPPPTAVRAGAQTGNREQSCSPTFTKGSLDPRPPRSQTVQSVAEVGAPWGPHCPQVTVFPSVRHSCPAVVMPTDLCAAPTALPTRELRPWSPSARPWSVAWRLPAPTLASRACGRGPSLPSESLAPSRGICPPPWSHAVTKHLFKRPGVGSNPRALEFSGVFQFPRGQWLVLREIQLRLWKPWDRPFLLKAATSQPELKTARRVKQPAASREASQWPAPFRPHDCH